VTWLRTASIALVAMVLALPSPARSETVQARDLEAAYEHLLRQVAEGVDLRALPAVYAMDEFEDYLDADRLLVDRRRLAADRGLHPTVRAHVAHKLAIDLMNRGDHAGADAVVEGVGFLTRFSVAGPFTADASVLGAAMAPERGIRGDDTWTDGDHSVRWRNADRLDFAGYVNMGALVHPVRGTTSYLTTTIHVPAATRATLWVGASGAYRTWVGSRLVADARDTGPAQPDQVGWPIELAKGPNVLVFKIAAARQSSSAGLYARLTDRRERPLAFHSTPLVAPVVALTADGRLRPLQSPAQVCARLAARDRLSGPSPLPRIEARYLAGYLLWRLHTADPERPWDALFRVGGEALADRLDQLEAVAVAERRNELRNTPMGVGAEGFAPLLAVGSARDTAQAQGHVDLASRATGGAAWARTSGLRVMLAGRGAGRIPPAWAELERLRQDAPNYWPAALLRAELDPAFGFGTTGLAQTRRLATALPNVPTVWRRYLRDLRGAGDQVDEMRALAHWLEFRAADGGSRARLAELLRGYRRPLEAAELLAQGRALAPEAVGLTRLHADALADADLLVEAAGVLGALGDRRPRDTSILLTRARLEDRRGNPREATALLERALALQPFDEGLRARIAHRLGSAPTRELSWLLAASHPSMRMPDCEATVCDEAAWDAAGGVVLVHQRIVHRHRDGRLTVVGQRVMAPRTAAGATRAATLDIPYVPGRSIVEILIARRVRKRGGEVSGFRRENRKPNGTTRGVYRQRATARITVPFVEPGDTVEIAWRVSDVVPPSVGADVYADLHYLQGRHPRLWSRYVVLGAPRLQHAVAKPLGATGPDIQARPNADGLVVIARDAPAVPIERHSAGRADISAYVHVSTTPTWDALGSWYWNLVKDQIIVDDNVRTTAAVATRGARSPRETVRRAYEWVARQTRYVGLDFGDHSYLPYRTTETLARGFGDCKDKATLLKALLSVHDIAAHLVLVRTRQRGDLRDGVASLRAFDHVILWVPSLDLYLDATSTWTGSETMPPRLQGAPALVVRDGVSAEFTRLPRRVASANLLERRITADLRTGSFRADLRATGNYAAGYRAVVAGDPTAMLQSRLGDEFGVRVTRATLGTAPSLDAPFTARVTASGARWLVPTAAGAGRMPLGPAPGLVATWAAQETRRGATRIPFPFTLATHAEIRLPRGARADLTGLDAQESSDLGSFRVRVEQRGDIVTIDARYSLAQASVSRTDYARFRTFLQRADAALGANLAIEGLP
jgi:cellulose synthase operon protein C